MSNNKSKLFLGGFFIFIVSLLTFLPSFNLALFGDDWLAFYRYLFHLGPKSNVNYTHFSYFLTPYGPQDIIMGLLRHIFGLQGSYYHMTSYTLRLLAAFSFFPIVFYLTRDKLATFFAMLFFSVTTTGIETTNWVFNMPSYISIAFLNLFLYFFLKSREDGNTKLLIPAAITFYLAFIWAPIRMTGSLPAVFLIGAFWFFRERTFKVARKVILSSLVILGAFLATVFIGQANGASNVWTDRFAGGLQQGLAFLSTGRFDFLFYPVIIFGGLIFPDFVLPLQWQVESVIQLIFSVIIPALFIFLLLIQLLVSLTGNLTALTKKIVLFSSLWSLIVIYIYLQNSSFLNIGFHLFLLTFGGYFIILFLILLIKYFRQANVADGIFVSLIWSLLSFFPAWWWMPETVYPSTHRYLTVSFVGIAILFAIIISLGKAYINRLYLTVVLSFFLLLHLFSTNYYLRLMESFHSQQITDKIWSSIPRIDRVGKEPLVFYFEGNAGNYAVLHNVLTFGFPPHMQIMYRLTGTDFAPVPMTNWNEVVSAVKDGQSFKAYGYPLKPISINQVYAFSLQGRDNLINITDLARQKLASEEK